MRNPGRLARGRPRRQQLPRHNPIIHQAQDNHSPSPVARPPVLPNLPNNDDQQALERPGSPNNLEAEVADDHGSENEEEDRLRAESEEPQVPALGSPEPRAEIQPARRSFEDFHLPDPFAMAPVIANNDDEQVAPNILEAEVPEDRGGSENEEMGRLMAEPEEH